jgi:glutamyl-tRNA reductase
MEEVFLYNIDDLQAIVQENLSRREAELARADAIVSEELARFVTWLQSRRIVPTVVALRDRFEKVRQAELRRLEPRLASLPPDARARVDEITHLIVEKLLLTPTEQLKSLGDDTSMVSYADAVTRLFALAEDQAAQASRPVRVAARNGRAS